MKTEYIHTMILPTDPELSDQNRDLHLKWMTSRGRLEAVWMEFRAIKFRKQPFRFSDSESRGEGKNPEGRNMIGCKLQLRVGCNNLPRERVLIQIENLASICQLVWGFINSANMAIASLTTRPG
jgi:hypothetical protein